MLSIIATGMRRRELQTQMVERRKRKETKREREREKNSSWMKPMEKNKTKNKHDLELFVCLSRFVLFCFRNVLNML